MLRSGDTIENPVTGETLIFHRTSADTNGEYVLVECIVKPGGFVAGAHVHPRQTETFRVLSGTVGIRVGRRKMELEAGEEIKVEPGTVHKFWNAGEDDARFLCEVRPAYQFERLIETMYGLAQAGKTSRKGLPNPLRLAVIANYHRDDLRAPYAPAALQRMALAMGSLVGRAAGFEPTHERTVEASQARVSIASLADAALVG
jgi:mannose-6-phosphate isomerase-like protein (cupin superfamily)